MLYGKTIVITGVASGIGARAAELAAHLGADVIGIDLRKPATALASFIENGITGAAMALPSLSAIARTVARPISVWPPFTFWGPRVVGSRRSPRARGRRHRQRGVNRGLRLAR